LRGTQTYRELAQLTGLSAGTLQAAAKGERLPTWRVTESFATACGSDGTMPALRELWKDACAAEGHPVPDDPPDAPPVPEPGSLTIAAQFIAMMNQLRAWAGTPSYTELNKRAGGHNLLPPATLSDVLRRQRLPRLELVLAYVRACGLSDEQATAWEQAWAALREHDLIPAGQQPPAELPQEPPSRAARALARREATRAASRHFLIWLSGARPELLKHSRTDRPAYTGLGAAILVTGIIAGLSMAFALRTALYAPELFAVPLGAAWGATIMALDRWMVTTIHRGATLKILPAVTPRVVLSLLFAVIFTMPLLLRMFAPEISTQLTVIDQAHAEQVSASLAHGELGTQITLLQNELNKEQTQAAAYYKEWECQLFGGCGNHAVGNGPLAEAAHTAYESAASQVVRLNEQLSQERVELTKLEQQASNVIIRDAPGLLERLDALDQLASRSAVVSVTRVLVFLFFALTGCLPIIVRTLHVIGPQGAYETLLKIQERADIQNGSMQIRNQASPPVPPHHSSARRTASRPQQLQPLQSPRTTESHHLPGQNQ
jgi:hypothetical protein